MYYLLLYQYAAHFVKGLWCCFPIPSLIFIYSMMRLLIYKYKPLWQEVSVKSLTLRWPLRPVGLLLVINIYTTALRILSRGTPQYRHESWTAMERLLVSAFLCFVLFIIIWYFFNVHHVIKLKPHTIYKNLIYLHVWRNCVNWLIGLGFFLVLRRIDNTCN